MIVLAAIKKDNIIYTGKRHAWIMWENPYQFKGNDNIQGFITNTGEFVDRKIAAQIAYQCGQIDQEQKELYSEDIITVTQEEIEEAQKLIKR